MSLSTVLIIVALIAFAVAATGFSYRKLDFIAAGLAFWSLAELLPRFSSLNLSVIVLLLAFAVFVLAAIGWRRGRFSLVALGLAIWMASILLPAFHIG
jgi:hypothetical protein